MRIGMVGLGRMGANMTRRLLRGGHEVVVHDLSADAMRAVADEGAEAAGSLDDLVAALPAPRAVWVMVPAGQPTEDAVATLRHLLSPGDTIVDGGNSRYTDTVTRAALCIQEDIDLVDAGTSGGIWGLAEGFCLMVGGEDRAVARLEPIFTTLAPANGYAHVGPSGAGHYTKMIHNGVEYALMQAYAEGFELLHEGAYDIDVAEVAEVWRHGSVVRSWLLDLAARALEDDPKLSRLSGYVEDSGEGRWSLDTAVEYGIPAPTIAAALFTRFQSRRENTYGNRMLAALRNQFGGHAVRAIEKEDHV